MKKMQRFLTMAVVVSMIAALPASAQSVSAGADDGNLALLVSVNRLELTQEQMAELHDILSDLLESRSEMGTAVDAFEQVMIEFSGTNEELDELLAAFREDQIAQAEAMHEVVASSIDAIGDLLSINQGVILKEELPELLGLGQAQRMTSAMGQRMTSRSMGRRSIVSVQMESPLQGVLSPMVEGLCESSAIQSTSQQGYWNEVASSAVPTQSSSRFGLRGMQSSVQPSLTSRMMQSSAERELMLRGLQTGQWPDLTSSTMENRAGRALMLQLLQDGSDGDLPEMLQQQLGQMSEGIEMYSEQLPDELKEQLEQRLSGRVDVSDGSSMMIRGQMGLRFTDRGSLFDLAEQLVEVLELKLDALE